ncbi:MAG: GNAT family N-acetyltransferase [Flavobacteriales bacterium]|jgi:GNAT superfamily N-acetyltransferase
MPSSVDIRKGKPSDIPAVFDLIKELAEYEKAAHEVAVSPQELEEWAFGKKYYYEFLVAVEDDKILGISLYYTRFSTWKGPLLYLEDLIVTEAARGRGLGKMLFEATMRQSLADGRNGMIWQVLDWNEPAIRFYDSFGATYASEWLNGKLSKQQIEDYLEKI